MVAVLGEGEVDVMVEVAGESVGDEVGNGTGDGTGTEEDPKVGKQY